MANQRNLILALDSPLANLQNSGCKAANLSSMIRAGFPVPPGLIITTAAYQEFVTENSLIDLIDELVSNIDPKDTKQLQEASTQIRGRFETGKISPGFVLQIQTAYENLENQSVAVRSSATAEDLPGLSFAGQQDTFLNISSLADLMKAIIFSWSSLWTARAIGYRARNKIPHGEVAQAVIIQEMLPCFSSGVLFTANPITGSRSEMVIDATFGLGEALVSGQIEPDHYVVDIIDKQIIDRKIGSKSIAMYAKESGGFSILDIAADDMLVLSDEKILELAEYDEQAAELFGYPQNIE